MTFAEEIKRQREYLGLTQLDAAEMLGVSEQWVRDVESGIGTIHPFTKEGAMALLMSSVRSDEKLRIPANREGAPRQSA